MIEDTLSAFTINGPGVNPHFAACLPDGQAWIRKYRSLICGPKMCTYLENCNFELFAAYIVPSADSSGLKATMDFVNILWTCDEITDTESVEATMKYRTVIYRALQEPDFDDGTWVCHMIQDFRRDHFEKFGPNVARRFIKNFYNVFVKLSTEVELRDKKEVLNIKHYIDLRRDVGAVRPSFDLVEYSLGLDLPNYVYENPIFISGYNAALDMVCWLNDLFSYDMEQAKGQGGANAVTVVMKSRGNDLQSAVDFIAGFCEALSFQFLESQNSLQFHSDPVFSQDSVRFLEALGDWVRGSSEWSFITERYFGKENDKVKKTRIVELTVPFENSLNALKEHFSR